MSSIPSNDQEATVLSLRIKAHTLSGDEMIGRPLGDLRSVTRPDRLRSSDLCELPGVRDLLESHKPHPESTGEFIPTLAGYNVLDPTLLKYVSAEGEELHAQIGCPVSEKPTDPEGSTSIQALVFKKFIREGYHPIWSATSSGLLGSLLLTAESLKAASEITKRKKKSRRTHPLEYWLPCPSKWGPNHAYFKFSKNGVLLGPRRVQGQSIYVPIDSSMQQLSEQESSETSQTVKRAFDEFVPSRWTCDLSLSASEAAAMLSKAQTLADRPATESATANERSPPGDGGE
ncbi:hypothetical protein DB88DRAFT_471694 [Papiliotrema laurentii]|uniref:Uncharacterized protein n=1 Tax=Papiliotrema laurentii TaxID=5418 RepID=A0AAD9FSX1_PAPLA|nr:hypothetical protein DB88DRAFT_471694 [Papiliotrema laurentii]